MKYVTRKFYYKISKAGFYMSGFNLNWSLPLDLFENPVLSGFSPEKVKFSRFVQRVGICVSFGDGEYLTVMEPYVYLPTLIIHPNIG